MIWNFFKRRIPFYIRLRSDTIYVTRGYSGTHEIWGNQLGFSEKEKINSPRGFYWRETNELFFYVGGGTEFYATVAETIKERLIELFEKVGANDETIIYGGAIIGDDSFRGIHRYGTAREFLAV